MRRAAAFSLIVTVTAGLVLASCNLLPPHQRDGEDKVCTQIGCSDGYALHLEPATSRFAAGRYDVRLKPEDEPVRACYFVVSNDADRCASGHCVADDSCNAVYTVGYEDPDRMYIEYPVLENTLDVVVERDGAVVGEATFEPEYETLQPNGPDCPPTCRRARNDLLLE